MNDETTPDLTGLPGGSFYFTDDISEWRPSMRLRAQMAAESLSWWLWGRRRSIRRHKREHPGRSGRLYIGTDDAATWPAFFAEQSGPRKVTFYPDANDRTRYIEGTAFINVTRPDDDA